MLSRTQNQTLKAKLRTLSNDFYGNSPKITNEVFLKKHFGWLLKTNN